MSRNDQEYFKVLKNKVVAMMQQTYPGINPSISEWKGQEITDFQEELRRKVGENISEKWFYTHMKSEKSALPRIDVLNFLSRYAGYANWDDFVFRQGDAGKLHISNRTANRYFVLVPMVTVAVVGLLYVIFLLLNTREYRFCFFDADTRQPLTDGSVVVTLLPDNESPVTVFAGTEGCFTLKTDKSRIRMVVSSPYYRTDTIVRILKKMNRHETVSLHANNYALMIHYMSQVKVDDWQKRRDRLNEMFSDDAMICQFIGDKESMGIELLNKSEFIDRLTVPSGSLKNLEVLDTKFMGDKISLLKFRVKPEQR